jgi:ribonuclease P protein component
MAEHQPPRYRFRSSSRIKQGRDFARLKQKGERRTSGGLVVNWLRMPTGSDSRLGVVTSGKVGGAVVRNRVRRLLREAFRLHQRELAHPVDLVLVARQSIAGKRYAEVENEFLAALRKAGLLNPAAQ